MVSVLVMAVLSVGAQADSAPTSAPPSPDDVAADEAPAPIEFVGGDEPWQEEEEEAPPAAPVEPEGPVDSTPPKFHDFAIASGAWTLPPTVSAVVTDDYSGIDDVTIFFRTDPKAEFVRAPLLPESGGLFRGELPAGTQQSGFSYYAEARDAAGNVAKIGNDQEALDVPPAPRDQRRQKVRKTQAKQETELDYGGVHPIFIAAAAGATVVGMAVVGIFGVDFVLLQLQLQQPGQSQARRDAITNAAIGDAIISSIAGVIAVGAGAATAGMAGYNMYLAYTFVDPQEGE